MNRFLPAPSFDHAVLDPDNPFALDPLTPGPILMKYRKTHLDAMANALDIIDEVDQKFGDAFGRYYGGTISGYRMEDAEVVIITNWRNDRHRDGRGRSGKRGRNSRRTYQTALYKAIPG